jgi:hypothetical protein
MARPVARREVDLDDEGMVIAQFAGVDDGLRRDARNELAADEHVVDLHRPVRRRWPFLVVAAALEADVLDPVEQHAVHVAPSDR